MKKQNVMWLGNGILLVAAVIWGFAFAAQDIAAPAGSFAVVCLRYGMGGLVLLALLPLLDRLRKNGRHLLWRENGHWRIGFTKPEWLGGAICGVFLALASVLQQIGIESPNSDPAKAGFITALYVLLVPIFGLFFHRRPGVHVWISAVIALGGFYLLTANISITDPTLPGFFTALFSTGFHLYPSDLWILACAVVFSCQILSIDHFAPRVDGVRMACIQFLTVFLVSMPGMFIAGLPSADVLASTMPAILYLGLLSTAIAYTLQIVGQKYTDPTVATVIMSLESVFSALGAVLFLGEWKTPLQYVGGGIVVAAVILAQLPLGRKKEK